MRIRDLERRETDILNFLPDATFAIERTGHVIAWNKAVEEMTGIPAAGMLGRGTMPMVRCSTAAAARS